MVIERARADLMFFVEGKIDGKRGTRGGKVGSESGRLIVDRKPLF